jgi:hypothetical protein
VKLARPSLVQAARPVRKHWVETPHWRNVRTAQDGAGGNASPP